MIKNPSLLCVYVVLLISGCAATTNFDRAKTALEELLPYPQFTEYRNLQAYPGEVVCGEFESPEQSFRTLTGWRPFIFVEKGMGPSNSPEAVKIFCSTDSASSLYETLGIDLRVTGNEALMKILRDLTDLTSVIDEFKRLNKRYPVTEEGLSILVTDGTVRGLLERIPEDPWGKPYRFESIQWGGSDTLSFKLWTFGKDNEVGGVGDDADVSYKHLSYIEHVISLYENQ